MKIEIRKLRIDYDENYGCDNRTGWSIAWCGHYLVQLEKSLIKAIYKSITNE
ncbi:MAG: hypothetical protein ACUZ8I_07735 [Candidatus Scalindua sp.]